MNTLPRTPEEVFHAFAPRVYTLARRMLGHWADAEEVTHGVLLQVMESLDAFTEISELSDWLRRVAVRAVLARRRR